MQKQLLALSLVLLAFSTAALSQKKDSAVYFKGATRQNRDLLRLNLIRHTINSNLSLPLNDDTEENWMDAFGGLELLQYQSPWADARLNMAFDSIQQRSAAFQRALLELAYARYPQRFIKQVSALQQQTSQAKIFAMCTEYLWLSNQQPLTGIDPAAKKRQIVHDEKDDAIVNQLFLRIQTRKEPTNCIPALAIDREFLPHYTILFSFQRKNRNYPGLALIRDTLGNLLRDAHSNLFSVPQLARSVNNLPGYLTNGNTPQGIYRMYGFDTSKTYFIGPTANIQLTMPFETTLQHFFNDSTIIDSVWTEEWYKKLLPRRLEDCRALYESYYAGKAGRTEIIAHGTTVDPAYYHGEPYYPLTPTMGCLCTREIWSEINGVRLESDQQKLATAIQLAGGPNGYCVVIEIDDADRPVSLQDILPLLQKIAAK